MGSGRQKNGSYVGSLSFKDVSKEEKKKGSTKVKGKIFIRRENLCRN